MSAPPPAAPVPAGIGLPFAIRRPRLLAIGIAVLAAAIAIDRLTATPTGAGVDVAEETGPDGHATIGIAAGGSATAPGLGFHLLAGWEFDAERPTPPPADVAAWDGRRASLTGFMYPLAEGERISAFCLLRTTQVCCFGPRPQYSQYVLIETRAPVPFERLRPVTVHGRFAVDAQPAQGYIYRMDDAVVVRADGPAEPVDAAAYAARHGMPAWPWSALAGAGADRLPPELAALDGRVVAIDGYTVLREPGPPAELIVADKPGPGTAGGELPSWRTSLTVRPAPDAPAHPPWVARPAWYGTLRLAADPAAWRESGVGRIEDARPCTIPAPGRRPIIGAGLAAVLLLAVLLASLDRRLPTRDARP